MCPRDWCNLSPARPGPFDSDRNGTFGLFRHGASLGSASATTLIDETAVGQAAQEALTDAGRDLLYPV